MPDKDKLTCPFHKSNNSSVLKNEKRTFFVIILTGITMVAEIVAGHLTGSMALLADGYHMGSHMAALLVTYIVYRLSRMPHFEHRFSFGTGKILPLGGFSSAVLLAVVAFIMVSESIQRLWRPIDISYLEAIFVAVIGLVVNIVSAFVLFDRHHHHTHDRSQTRQAHDGFDDHNLKSAYFHVLADALTSVLAIMALSLGILFGITFLDPLIGIVGGFVVIRWAYNLAKGCAVELLDAHPRNVDRDAIMRVVEENGDEIIDLHVWKNTPQSTACELIVKSNSPERQTTYRTVLESQFGINHSIIEVQFE